MGDTDRTPDGGFSAGYLEFGGQNLRKSASDARHARAAWTLRGSAPNPLAERRRK